MNRVTLIGNLGADPEVRSTQAGEKVASLRVATSEKWTDKTTGEVKEKTDWHRVIAWGWIADDAGELSKGARVVVEGRLETREWASPEGQKRWVTEVIVRPGFGLLVADRLVPVV